MTSYLHFTVFKHLQITYVKLILETWKHFDYMHFVKANPMSHKSLNSDHCLSRYCDLTSCKNFNFEKFYQLFMYANFTTFPSLLIPDRWNLVIRFVLPRCNKSNIFISVGLTDGKLFAFYFFKTFANNSPSINPRDMKTLRLYAFCQDESNEP